MNEMNPNRITNITGINLLNNQEIDQNKLLIRLDGTTLTVQKRSFFSIEGSERRIFNKAINIFEADTTQVQKQINNVIKIKEILNSQIEKIAFSDEDGNNRNSYLIVKLFKKIISNVSMCLGWKLSTQERMNLYAKFADLRRHPDNQ